MSRTGWVRCLDCQAQVSRQLTICPYCCSPLPNRGLRRHAGPWLPLLLVVLAVSCACFSDQVLKTSYLRSVRTWVSSRIGL
ncbi:MAG: hypothetical protein ACUVUC_16220 [Thermoguttaceae bacterium]